MKKTMQDNNVEKLVSAPMVSTIVEKYINEPIVKFEDITNMTDLEEIFDGNDRALLFVAINSPNNGHYQCMFRNDNGLFFFDSYGDAPCQIIKELNRDGKDTFGQDCNLLRLVKKSKYKNSFHYNKHKLQKLSDSVQTCGRYCVMVLALAEIYKNDFSLEAYYKLMDYLKNKFKKSYDEIAAFFVQR